MPTNFPVSEYVRTQLQICGKSQKQIAEEAGFPSPNILTMIKQGLTKVPIARANQLADAMGVSKMQFMVRVLDEYHPEIIEAMEEAWEGLTLRDVLAQTRHQR